MVSTVRIQDRLNQETQLIPNNRFETIDLVRGIVMIIMALDHVRSYLHFDTFLFSPTDLQRTTVPIFFTRLITHLCAPTFILLAGSSAYFIAQQKTIQETAYFLRTRGAWLILLQITLIQLGWNFDPGFHYFSSSIISTIGFCMIALSFLIHLKLKFILAIGTAMVFGHNLLDQISFQSGSVPEVIWTFLHGHKIYEINNDYAIQFQYPLIPWIGVMALGYCFGSLYDKRYSSNRRKIILTLGVASLLTFLILRSINIYGDPHPWIHDELLSKTILSFLNLEKYPPSLDFICFTLGISLVLLGFLEGKNLGRLRPVILYGKVALFYYVLHIFVIHFFALLAVVWAGFPFQTMIFIGVPHNAVPEILVGNFGFSLAGTYLIWIGIVLFLYPFCTYWASFKARNKSKWWVSYV